MSNINFIPGDLYVLDCPELCWGSGPFTSSKTGIPFNSLLKINRDDKHPFESDFMLFGKQIMMFVKEDEKNPKEHACQHCFLWNNVVIKPNQSWIIKYILPLNNA